MNRKAIHIAGTLVSLILTLIVFEVTEIDLHIQDLFYNFQNHHWLIDRHSALLRFVFYDGAKILLILGFLGALLFFLFYREHTFCRTHRRGFLIFFLSAALVPGTIGAIKAISNVPCPRQIERYDGNYPYKKFLGSFPKEFHAPKKCKCFPAGHASGGFALLSLFFLFRKPGNRRIALGIALTAGWSMGMYKTLIGDHFVSHTIITMLLAWLMIQCFAWIIPDKSG